MFPPESAVFESLRRDWPDLPPIGQVERQQHVRSFTIGRDTAPLSLMDSPIPWFDLEQPCATAWYWPEAAVSLRHHQAHILVAVFSEPEDRVATALRRGMSTKQ